MVFISSTCIKWPNHPPQYINTLFSSVTWQIIVSTAVKVFRNFSCSSWPQTLLTGSDFGLYSGLLWPVFGSFTLWIIKPSEGTSLWPQDISLMSLWSQSLVPNFTGCNMMFIFQMMGTSTCWSASSGYNKLWWSQPRPHPMCSQYIQPLFFMSV